MDQFVGFLVLVVGAVSIVMTIHNHSARKHVKCQVTYDSYSTKKYIWAGCVLLSAIVYAWVVSCLQVGIL